MTKHRMTICALVAATTLIMASCGSDGEGSGYGGKGDTVSTSASTNPSGGAAAAVVSAADNPKLGRILVNSEGRTLYDFHKDKGGRSSCYDACAGAWPPLMTDGEPRATNGVKAPLLGTTRREDGNTQVTYAGHPLYTYVADTEPGETKGNDVDQFGAEWYALQPNGEEPED